MSKKKKNIELIVPESGNLSSEVVIEKQLRLSRADIIDLAFNEKLRELEERLEKINVEINDMRIDSDNNVKNAVLETNPFFQSLSEIGFATDMYEMHTSKWYLSGKFNKTNVTLSGLIKDIHGLEDKLNELFLKYKNLFDERKVINVKLSDMHNNQSKFKAEMIRKILLSTESGRTIIESINKIIL